MGHPVQYNKHMFHFFCRQNSQDNCLLSNVNLGFSDNFDDIISDPQWDLYRQFNDLQCSSDLDGSSGK